MSDVARSVPLPRPEQRDDSLRFTAQYLPCFRSTPQLRQETTALRDFGPAYDGLGSEATEQMLHNDR
jgi:hypothetical protein